MEKKRIAGFVSLGLPIVFALGYWWGNGAKGPELLLDTIKYTSIVLAIIFWLVLSCAAIFDD